MAHHELYAAPGYKHAPEDHLTQEHTDERAHTLRALEESPVVLVRIYFQQYHSGITEFLQAVVSLALFPQ